MFRCHVLILIFILILSISLKMVFGQNYQEDLEKCSLGLFEDIQIKTIADKNRHLRLNISWEGPLGKFDSFDLTIDTSETNCYLPNYYQDINVNRSFLIEPSLRMEHPAEKPSHGCKYNVSLFAENNGACFTENLFYVVPDCVDTICSCEKGPPYNLVDITELSNKTFVITFSPAIRELNLPLENVFNQIWYTRKDATTHVTKVQHHEIDFNELKKSLKFPLIDVSEGLVYVFHVDLFLDDCAYYFEKDVQIKVTEKFTYEKRIVLYTVLLLGTLALLAVYFSLKRWPRIVWKFRKYLPFLPRVPDIQTTPQAVLLNEVENVQYVPLDFMDNFGISDHYEIPRNKIVLRNKIGGGSFGEVYKCDFYPMNSSKCISAAAKMPLGNAPEEELIDFQAEVKIMKKIAEHGDHRNVIKMFACVTLEKPYIMVMELVTNGSLKDFLKNLRKEWEFMKNANGRVRPGTNNPQRFFPDNMVVENYLSPYGINENTSGGLKYSSLSFQDTTGSSSSGSESYVTPDGLRTPSTPNTPRTPAVAVHIPSTIEEQQKSDSSVPIVKITSPPRVNKFKRRNSANVSGGSIKTTCSGSISTTPNSPQSISSSGLPSCTETLLTPLDLGSPGRDEILLGSTPSFKPVLDSNDLQNFALQLANGMAFLESIGITHRDLAARNILISDRKVLKISDFGMARVGVYINNPQKRQPLRWMAPEAIEERKCDTKTDVWSFGVVLWEIGSLGAFPYGNLSNDLVLVHIRQGKRLERPEMCTDQLYALMQRCWLKDSSERPTFNEIAKSLDGSNGKIYVDFNQISIEYVFPPVQEDKDC